MPHEPISDPLHIAEQLFSAIERGDVEAVRALYALQAVIWHNHDQKSQPPEENIAVLRWVVQNIRDLRYDEVRRQRTDGGFVQQHVLRGRTANGTSVEIPACIVCTVSDGRITRLDEYLDSAQVMSLVRGS